MLTILFVCTGNTCRSSMAAALAQEIWLKKGGPPGELRIVSAGTAAFPDAPASSQAIAVMKEEGIDLSGHKAQQLTPDMVREADLVLTMGAGHKWQLLGVIPEAGDKIFLLKEFAFGQNRAEAGSLDIADPFGQPVDVYRESAWQLREAIERVVERLLKEKLA